MQDLDSPEAVAKGTADPDPIVMYLIVRESLGMSMGKACAQCAHVSQMLQVKYEELHRELTDRRDGWGKYPNPILDAVALEMELIYQEWVDTAIRKVVLGADEKEWEKVKEACKDSMVVVRDAGYTEVPEGSETVIGCWPVRKSQTPKIIKRLQVLK
jgi:peptidyl-tRNA hydrolase